MKKSSLSFLVLFVLVAVTAGAESEAVVQLKQKLTAEIHASPDASPKVKAFISEELVPLCTNPVFVEAVQAQNAKGMTLDAIKATDKAWAEAEEELPIHAELLSNKCAEEIRKITSSITAIAETFVMDNQGANVGQNELTSDCWQGDEPKWQNSYKNGQGGVDIGKNKLDRSSNRTMQQVSLPIISEDGQVIGAVTYGLSIDGI